MTHQDSRLRSFLLRGRKSCRYSFPRARGIYERVLELDPAMPEAHRELAMTLFELGGMDEAKDHLIDALRLRPDDAWSLVVLGNI